MTVQQGLGKLSRSCSWLYHALTPFLMCSRWLVHSIASYYGLHTWSITVGEPARREAYVGFHPPAPDSRAGLVTHPVCRAEDIVRPGEELPQPLYAQV